MCNFFDYFGLKDKVCRILGSKKYSFEKLAEQKAFSNQIIVFCSIIPSSQTDLLKLISSDIYFYKKSMKHSCINLWFNIQGINYYFILLMNCFLKRNLEIRRLFFLYWNSIDKQSLVDFFIYPNKEKISYKYQKIVGVFRIRWIYNGLWSLELRTC